MSNIQLFIFGLIILSMCNWGRLITMLSILFSLDIYFVLMFLFIYWWFSNGSTQYGSYLLNVKKFELPKHTKINHDLIFLDFSSFFEFHFLCCVWNKKFACKKLALFFITKRVLMNFRGPYYDSGMRLWNV